MQKEYKMKNGNNEEFFPFSVAPIHLLKSVNKKATDNRFHRSTAFLKETKKS